MNKLLLALGLTVVLTGVATAQDLNSELKLFTDIDGRFSTGEKVDTIIGTTPELFVEGNEQVDTRTPRTDNVRPEPRRGQEYSIIDPNSVINNTPTVTVDEPVKRTTTHQPLQETDKFNNNGGRRGGGRTVSGFVFSK